MVVWNKRLNARASFVFFVIGLCCATAAFAPPAPPFPIPISIDQPFAAVMFTGRNNTELLLHQDGENYEGCIGLKVINTVPINVTATVTPTPNMDLPPDWMVKLNEPGEDQPFQLSQTRNKITAAHEFGAAGDLEVCVRVRGVRNRWHAAHLGRTTVQVARVVMTVMPEI